MRSSSLVLMLAAALTLGCGSKSSSSASQDFSAPDAGSSSPPILSQSTSSLTVADLNLSEPQNVLHTGDCKVEYYNPGNQLMQSYREEVISDGVSQFSLKVLESLLAVPADWANRKRIREGFLFRYGSFEVRNEAMANQNFGISGDGVTLVIAGQTCDHYTLGLLSGNGSGYEIWVDQVSGLVLRSERYDKNGMLRFSREYESLNFSPDLGLATWFQGSHAEVELDLLQSLGDQLGLPVLLPTLLPAGYGLDKAFKLKEGASTWVKLVYSNGIEPLFMLQKPKALGAGGKSPKNGMLSDDPSKAAPPNYDARLHVLELDGVTGIHTEQPEGIFEVVGIADEQDLVDMVSSALPSD